MDRLASAGESCAAQQDVTRHITGAVLVMFLVAAAAACSGSDGGSTPTPTSPSPSPSPTPSPGPAPSPGCTASVTGVPSPLPWNGGRFQFTITIGSGCAWTARTDVTWADISPGSGNGTTAATLNVAQSAQPDSRTVSLIIGNQSFPYVQSAPTSCITSLSPASQEVADQGGVLTIVVTAPDGCSWTAATSASWIRVATPSGTGSGSVSLDVSANPGAARQAFVTIGNQQASITQRAR